MPRPAFAPSLASPPPDSKAVPAVAAQVLARQVARAAASFEYEHLGREPSRVTVVTGRNWMVVSLQASLAPLERIVVRHCPASAAEIERRQRLTMDRSINALREHVVHVTGVELAGAMVSVDAATGSVLKTFTTVPAVDLFLLGQGMPFLGVSIDAHVHADGPYAPEARGINAVGTNHAVRREPFAMTRL